MAELSAAVDGAIDALVSAVFATVSVLGVKVELIVLWMAAPMLGLTVYLGFVNLRHFATARRVLAGHYHDDAAPGEISQFQALATALSGTVGLGNIAGVAVAIAMGGPGAAFWMAAIGFFAMTLKFAEVTLSVKYRLRHDDGAVSGGPMHYLRLGLAARGQPRLGRWLAWSYALLALPAILQIAQVNQSFSQIALVLAIDGPGAAWGYGLLLSMLTGVVIIGGIRSIARVTARLVPAMALLYLAGGLTILAVHATAIPEAVLAILRAALAPEAGIGGVIGAFVVGMRRAVYSSEAGLGSATIAHAAAKTREPVSEGIVALMEPFIDTVVICSMTALVIVVTGAHRIEGLDDVRITSAAFNSVLPGFDVLLALAVFLFAFSTIVSWAYYTGKVWAFVFGGARRSMAVFKAVYCAALIPGAAFTVRQVFDIMDSLFFLMAVPNIIGIYLMASEVRRDLRDYEHRLARGLIVANRRS
ncbi:MAG: alanine:cation symporter family protein [Alphaproteobacteria bacterium]|nr:MAG: alanine:cation symporter family protein [Alphaproteobacteria bacterium]